MKKTVSVLSTSLILAASLFFATPAQAVPGTCSPEDPCDTYAVVDGSGNVVNAIVCQPSVCGSGEFAGLTVVPQVKADTTTGQNRGGYLTGGSISVAESQGTFIVTNNSPVSEVKQVVSDTSTTNLEVVIGSGTQQGFRYEDTTGTSNDPVVLQDIDMKSNTSAKLTATKTVSGDSTDSVTESITFLNRETADTVIESISLGAFNILVDNIQAFLSFRWLEKWFKI